MYLLINAVKWLSILFLTYRLHREIRMKARIGQAPKQGDETE